MVHVLQNGICTTCQPEHVLDNGQCLTCGEGLDDDTRGLLHALNEYGSVARAWTAEQKAKHPRGPGGRFLSVAVPAKDALDAHFAGKGDGKPLKDFTREHLRKAAKARGIALGRGEDRDSIEKKILDSISPAQPAKKTPARKRAASKPATKQAALDAAPVKLGTLGTSTNYFERGVDGDRLDADALAFYRGHGYIEANAYLREGRTFSGEGKAKWTVEQIDAIMSQSRLTRDVQVHRGVGGLGMFGHAGTGGKSLVGMEYTEPAYASTTADPNVAREFYAGEDYGGRGAILNIRVPAGTKAIQLSGLGPKPKHDWELPRPPEQEAELLLQRGLTYRITGDRTVNGIRYLDAEVVPK